MPRPLPTPRPGPLNDFTAIPPVLGELELEFGIPYEVLVAQSMQESAWKLHAYRYEPGYDRRYVSSPKTIARWRADPDWLDAGISVDEWFRAHPERHREYTPGMTWPAVAQTHLAASYGPFQIMLPTARDLGFTGRAAELYAPEACRWGVRYLVRQLEAAKRSGWAGLNALLVALARYNGGAAGNSDPLTLRNHEYVALVRRRYRECWGREMAI